MSAPIDPVAQKRSRRMLLLIFIICLTPVMLAYALYFLKPGWLGDATTNHGRLQKPVKALSSLTLTTPDGTSVHTDAWHGHWTLIVLGGTQCDATCQSRAREIANIRPLLRSDQKRLAVYYIAPDATTAKTLAATTGATPLPTVLVDDGRALAFFAQPEDSTVLIDPLGNWVLSYTDAASPKDIYLDLKHLLRYSHVG